MRSDSERMRTHLGAGSDDALLISFSYGVGPNQSEEDSGSNERAA